MRGSDDTHVDRDAHGADADDGLLLQEAQQVGLQLQRQVTDLVQEDGASARRLDAAALALMRAGERIRVRVRTARSASGLPAVAPQFTGTNGPRARRERWWMARATSSLPVPLSPAMSTGASTRVTRSSFPYRSSMGGSCRPSGSAATHSWRRLRLCLSATRPSAWPRITSSRSWSAGVVWWS